MCKDNARKILLVSMECFLHVTNEKQNSCVLYFPVSLLALKFLHICTAQKLFFHNFIMPHKTTNKKPVELFKVIMKLFGKIKS